MTTYKPPCIVCGGEGCATSCAAPRFVVTTGGTYIGSVDFDAALRQLEIERDEARRERDKARAMTARLRAALEEKGCRPIAAGNDCEGCKAGYAATEKP